MPHHNVTKLSDEELEDIQRHAKEADIPEEVTEKAEVELDIRRKRKIYELQEDLIKTLRLRFNKISKVLKYIDDKPTKSVVFAALVATGVGVAINVISQFLIVTFNLK